MKFEFLGGLFLRAPVYHFSGYDLERMQEVLDDGVFREAVYLASPVFFGLLEKQGFVAERLDTRARHTLYKYYNRMCFRPVPFGGFASFTVLDWGEGATVRLGGPEQTWLHVLPDEGLYPELNRAAYSLKPGTLLIKNPTLYRVQQEYRYVKSAIEPKGHYRFSLDALPAGRLHQQLFAYLGKGRSYGELTDWLCRRSGCDAEAAGDYLHFLLMAQVLYGPQQGTIIGYDLAGALQDIPPLRSFWERQRRRAMNDPVGLKGVTAELEALLPAYPGKAGGMPFYAAVSREHAGGGPGGDIREALLAALGLLNRLALPGEQPVLDDFISAFRERFDLEKVPLLLALDPDAGVPYGNFGIAGDANGFADLRFPQKKQAPPALEWTAAHRWLFSLWSAAKQQGPYAPLAITAGDLNSLPEETAGGVPAPTLAVMFRKTEDHLLLEYAGGAAATALTGRFSAFSTEVGDLCRQLAAAECAAHPDILFADIGQLSDLHTDNINRRERIYPFEIPLNVFSASPPEMQLLPDDLLLSVRNGELILESSRLKKRVVPRLATAFNYRHNELAVFRLLCDLQTQGLQGNLSFSMRSFFPGLKFYPRVSYGQTVLALATWYLEETDLPDLKREDASGCVEAIRLFRERQGLPQRISLGETDQQLVFDLGDRQETLFFAEALRGLQRVTLTEYLLPGRFVKSGNKPLAGQFIAFAAHKDIVYQPVPVGGKLSGLKAQRNFMPGDRWLYLKLYCTPESADQILAQVILPVIRKNRGNMDHWFFIRYYEEGYHLRLRILVKDGQHDRLLGSLRRRLERTGFDRLLRNYQGGTYRREIERYGAEVIALAETFFGAGSELVCLNLVAKEPLAEFRLGLLTTFRLMLVFLPEEKHRVDFTKRMSARYLAEFAADKPFIQDLDLKYRAMGADVQLLLTGPVRPALRRGLDSLLAQAARILPVIAKQTSARLESLLADLVHMQLNRTFRVKQRQQELFVYYFLHKYLVSVRARNKMKADSGN